MRAAGAMIACALPPLFGFVVPAAVLADLLIAAGGPAREFWQHLCHSLTLAAAAAMSSPPARR